MIMWYLFWVWNDVAAWNRLNYCQTSAWYLVTNIWSCNLSLLSLWRLAVIWNGVSPGEKDDVRSTSEDNISKAPCFRPIISPVDWMPVWHFSFCFVTFGYQEDWVEMAETCSSRWGWRRKRPVISPVITAVCRFPNALFSNSSVCINRYGVTWQFWAAGELLSSAAGSPALLFPVRSQTGDLKDKWTLTFNMRNIGWCQNFIPQVANGKLHWTRFL